MSLVHYTFLKTRNNLKNLNIPLKTLLMVVNAAPSKFRSRIINIMDATMMSASNIDHQSEKYCCIV